MANELRLRVNNVSGSINDNPLTNVATTINSPLFADLPTVDATNHLILTLDPLEIYGAAEHVRVTAHTAAATSVTVIRGQESSAARQHPLGTVWFHGPVASDFGLTNSYADPWLTFSPTWTQGVTVTKTDLYSRYTKDGRRVTFSFSLQATGAGTATTTQSVSLPFPVAGLGGERIPMGTATFFDSSANTFYHCLAIMQTPAGTALIFYPTAATGGLGSQFLGLSASGGTTAAVAVNDTIAGTVVYEATT